jgi:hypothetical protein
VGADDLGDPSLFLKAADELPNGPGSNPMISPSNSPPILSQEQRTRVRGAAARAGQVEVNSVDDLFVDRDHTILPALPEPHMQNVPAIGIAK